jgi:hypothetical protein
LRVDLKGVKIFLEEERSVSRVFAVDFSKEVFFGVGIETELFHGLIFRDVSDSILELGTVDDLLQIWPDWDVFLNTHL